jgi:hypothetical protein
LYILLILKAKQTFPKIFPKNLIWAFKHGCIGLISDLCQKLELFLLEHCFKEVVLDLNINVDDPFNQGLSFNAQPHRVWY